MKKPFSFLVLPTSFFSFGLDSIYAGDNNATQRETATPAPIRPQSLVYIPIEAWVNDVELSVVPFDYPVSVGTISLTDKYGANIYYTLPDTGIDLPVETRSDGVYVITIQYEDEAF